MTAQMLTEKRPDSRSVRMIKTVVKRTGTRPYVDWLRAKVKRFRWRNLEVTEFVRRVNEEGGTYHRLDWGNGLVMNGIYDLSKYLHRFQIPDDLSGKKALDVGTASGFFAYECARRGASVTGIDLFENRRLYFDMARKAGFDVRYVRKNIYSLSPRFGTFDVVICGSLLLHLCDPFGAIQRLRSVCRGQLIMSTASLDDPDLDDRPYCEFKGIRTSGGDGEYWHYWEMTGTALKKMMLMAGFSKAQVLGRFVLEVKSGMNGCDVPHVVVKGIV